MVFPQEDMEADVVVGQGVTQVMQSEWDAELDIGKRGSCIPLSTKS